MRKIILLLFAITFTVGCHSPEDKQPQKTGTIPAIDSLIIREIEQGNIPGAVVRIQQSDSILHRNAYGYALEYDYEREPVERPESMTTGHLFDLASLTKVSATTFGIMLLADRGELQLDDPIHQWLPEFSIGRKKDITVRHLLTHTAGLYQWKPTYYFADNRKEQYRYIADLPLKWEVGADRHYSDLGFMLLGEIIERISGRPLNAFLEDELYKPLNLQHTVFNPKKKGFNQIAATSHGNPFEKKMVYDDEFGYRVDADPKSWNGWRTYTLRGEVNDGNAWYAGGGVAGHAGLFSTVDDLQVLVDLLLNKGSFKNKQLISSTIIDTFLTKNCFGNGLGWAMDPDVISAEGTPSGTFGHTGFTGTNIVAIPDYDLSIILLTNRQHVGPQPSGHYYDLGPIRQKIVDEILKSRQR